MADLLIHAKAAATAATAARAAGQPRLSDEQLAEIHAWYRGASSSPPDHGSRPPPHRHNFRLNSYGRR